MEQNKLENEFRNKLNQREINPSENSWDRLDAMLTVAEEKKPIRSYSWIYIAASSIIGFAFLGTFFFNQSNEIGTIESNEVVIENSQKVEPIQKETHSIIPSNSKSESIAVISEAKNVKKNPRAIKSIIINQNQLAQNSNSDSLTTRLKNSQSIQEAEQLASSNSNNNSVDEMLAAVQTAPKAAIPKTAVKVNPNTLLSQVDGELELSFREKVINKVNKNYQTVKVALANRNQE
ncbi:MAG: hypothetical protein C0412_11115 [Flavobacterium sp.]|nr:hypothetical protein [Flavobacterium sp.]